MAKSERAAEPAKPPERPRFNVSFHAEGDSMEELHKKMGKAFGGKGEHKRGSRKRGMKRELKKREARK